MEHPHTRIGHPFAENRPSLQSAGTAEMIVARIGVSPRF